MLIVVYCGLFFFCLLFVRWWLLGFCLCDLVLDFDVCCSYLALLFSLISDLLVCLWCLWYLHFMLSVNGGLVALCLLSG